MMVDMFGMEVKKVFLQKASEISIATTPLPRESFRVGLQVSLSSATNYADKPFLLNVILLSLW